MIELERITKKYSTAVALDGVNASIKDHRIVTFVGPNGAGKTTLIKILSTELYPSEGRAFVLGYDVVKEAKDLRTLIAIVPQEADPEPDLTPMEHIKYYLWARGFSRTQAASRAKETLEDLDLWDRRNITANKLSGGFRRRILIGMALATDAELIFLDEPTVALDPVARRLTWDLLSSIKDRRFVLTTHYMDEAEALSDEIIFINEGRIVAQGSSKDLLGTLGFDIKVVVDMEAYECMKFFSERVISHGNQSLIYTTDPKAVGEKLLSMDVPFRIERVTLEDFFFLKVGGKDEQT
ncbi:MAG: ABC transporter ATP-binding protein [Candidatus Thermoplasmatota archaeon]|nr:ABC transporter ATP-binding protein [Candidatus Thermoplasmatota archaeon]